MKIYAWSLVIVVILAFGNYMGQEYGWAQMIPIYDVYLHLLGGLGIGLFLVAAAETLGISPEYRKWLILAGVIAAGAVWEVFEAYYHIAGAPVGTRLYYIDTTKDFINDFIGGAIGVWLALRAKAKTA